MLRACRRVLRPGGRLAFLTIHVAQELTVGQRRRAVRYGPPAPTGPDNAELAVRAGFVDVTATDVTADYLTTALAWQRAREQLRDELRPLGPEEYDAKRVQARHAVEEIRAGRLRRTLVTARRPAPA